MDETLQTMPTDQQEPDVGVLRSPLRVWPALVLLLGIVLTRLLPEVINNGPPWLWMLKAFGPIVCGILMLIWWVAASRASWSEKGIGFLGVAVLFVITLLLIDRTMLWPGAMLGPGVLVVTIPLGLSGFGIGTVFCRRMLTFRRTLVALCLAAAGFGYSTLLRSDGMWGNYTLGLHWRWEPSSEDQLVHDSERRQAPAIEKTELETALSDPEWPGFRGPARDGRQSGSIPATDWKANPPELLWKIIVGPGWSSFAVAGNLLFTQEQRSNAETVVCYEADSGLEVWTHPFETRFEDSLGGPGPRATPTLAGTGLYVMGGTGILARLVPATGELVWQQDVRKIAERELPTWGFASSPLVVDSRVIVYAGGKAEKGILAFDCDSGDLEWSAPAGDQSYSSPQLSVIHARDFILSLSNTGLDFLNPADGATELRYEWPIKMHRSLQPQVFESDTLLIPSDLGDGTRRIRIVQREGGFAIEEVWKSHRFKPDFNDCVIHDGHAYGFDNRIFACLDLSTGELAWKGGRYGKGQVLLLESAGLLLVMGETGQVVLLEANPERHVELASFQALEGKTWNHPVVVGDRLYVRNSQQAAAYRLPVVADSASGQ